MSKHRQTTVRPRYARLASAGASVVITATALLGGTGVLPLSAGGSAAQASNDLDSTTSPKSLEDTGQQASRPQQARSTGPGISESADAAEKDVNPKHDVALPAGSGTGKRVVFSQSRQRVWLVDGKDTVVRTYLVSGSIYDNLEPGAFNVYSRSADAWGVDDSGSMKYFVRFTQGSDTGAAIGFHDIPVKDGQPAQTEAQLGTPLSHGCIRQKRSDAIALWKFAPLGTSVIVTA